jgi:hypothetical protein
VPGFELAALENANVEPSTFELGAHDRPDAVGEDPAGPLVLSDTRTLAELVPPVEVSVAPESLPGEQGFAPAPASSDVQTPLLPAIEGEAVAADTELQSGQPADEESFGWPLVAKEFNAAEALAEPYAEVLAEPGEASRTQVDVVPLDNPELDPYCAAEPPLAFPAAHESGDFLQTALADSADLFANNSRGLEHATLEPDFPSTGNFTDELASERVPVTEAISHLERDTEPKGASVTTVPEPEALSSLEVPSTGYPVLAEIAAATSISEAQALANSTVTPVPEPEVLSSEESPSTGYTAIAEIAPSPSISEAQALANSSVTPVPEPEASSSEEVPSTGYPVLAEMAAPSISEAQALANSTVTPVPEPEALSSDEFPSPGYPVLAEIAAVPSISEAHNSSSPTEDSWLDFHEPSYQPPTVDVPESFALAAANPTAESSEFEAAPPSATLDTAAVELFTAPETSEVTPAGDVIAAARPASPSEPLSAAAVEAIVTRVVNRVQLSITEVVTRELLRPIVEALVRSELGNH